MNAKLSAITKAGSHIRDKKNMFLIVIFLYISNLAGSQSRKAFIR